MKKIFTLILIVSLCTNVWSQCIPNSNSLSFNGTSSESTVPINPLLIITGPITIEAWINAAAWTTNTTPTSNSIVCKHGWQLGEQGYVLRAGNTAAGSTGQLSFNFAGIDTMGNYTSWQEVISPAGAMSTNTWYHVAGSFDGDTIKCYINGAVVGTTAFKGTIRDSSAYDLKIGRLAFTGTGQTRYWNGLIDEVRIWNRSLSQAEIDSNMNHHIDPTIQTGLVGYWRFNEGTGASIADLSGNNLNGTVTGTTWSTNVPFNIGLPAANLSYSLGILSVNPPAVHYQWYLNGNTLLNDTLQSWHPTQSGIYYVAVTGPNGCTALSSTLNITVSGIDEPDASNGIAILNNPAHNIATIQLAENIIADKIVLYDINGKLITTFNKISATTYTLACSGFNDGLYLISVYSDKGVFVKKLMIAHE